MSGKPAARQGDMTQYGGSIVQGSAGVRIGAPTGVACSVCPGGVTSGHPVNPLLGAKVLPGETDIALQGRYITQDPIGLKGGWNLYGYQLNPISDIDPLGLSMWEDAKSGACTNGLCGTLSAMIGPDKFDSIDSTAYDALNKINSQSICEDKEFAGLICKDNSGRYFSTAPNRGERKGSYPFNSPCPNGTEKVSAYHTHGADSHGEYWDEIFSGKDEKIVKSKDNNIKSFYLGTPSGNFKAIDNHGKEITNRKGLPNVCRVHGNM
ncbi:DUF4329 domain-containing protein [Escherichia coli]|uniref:DUF4329 domain-containing protein n=1 Tax=Escherichia coli TaxID=562 RepID=UPI00197ABFC0|nr:DUF4329 domain-containing protein [Escherichia coli]HDH8528940.1 DUF4329 domain-containing protein [Escherichia coli]